VDHAQGAVHTLASMISKSSRELDTETGESPKSSRMSRLTFLISLDQRFV
jgi:hypothetical protein